MPIKLKSSRNAALASILLGIGLFGTTIWSCTKSDSNANGEVHFPENSPPVAGDLLVMNTPGEHVGFEVETVLSRIVGEAPETDTPIIINPMTTLLASGWSEEQLLEVLQTAGLNSITVQDLYKNPMDGIENLDQTTAQESDLQNIQAAIATQAFIQVLRTMNSDNETKKVTPGMFAALPAAQELINNMVAQVKRNISKDLLTSIDAQMNGFQGAMT